MNKIKAGPWISGLRASLWQDQNAGTFVLSMTVHNRDEERHYPVFAKNARILDEFTNPNLAIEMLDLCTRWLGSDELTQAYILNTEDAIIDSWQDYSMIDWKKEEREELELLKVNPCLECSNEHPLSD